MLFLNEFVCRNYFMIRDEHFFHLVPPLVMLQPLTLFRFFTNPMLDYLDKLAPLPIFHNIGDLNSGVPGSSLSLSPLPVALPDRFPFLSHTPNDTQLLCRVLTLSQQALLQLSRSALK